MEIPHTSRQWLPPGGSFWAVLFGAMAALFGCQDTSPKNPEPAGNCKLAGTFLLGEPEIIAGACSLNMPSGRLLSMSVGELPNEWEMRLWGQSLPGKATVADECVFRAGPVNRVFDGFRANVDVVAKQHGGGIDLEVGLTAVGELASLCTIRLELFGGAWNGAAEGEDTGGPCGVGATCSSNLCAYGGVDACRFDVCLYERNSVGNEAIYCSEPCMVGSCPEGFICLGLGEWVFGSDEQAFCVRRSVTCGNGVLDIGEVCDDGNNISGDGCSADCTSNETCGNGIVDAALGEECDDGNSTSGDGCSANCRWEVCGNGIVDVAAGEECDDGNAVSGDGCSAECRLETCGNGIVDPGEGCDDGNTNDADRCSNQCRVRLSAGVARVAASWARNLTPDVPVHIGRHRLVDSDGTLAVVWSEIFGQAGGPFGFAEETFVSLVHPDTHYLLPPRRVESLSGWHLEDVVSDAGGVIRLLVRFGTSLALSTSLDGGNHFSEPKAVVVGGLPMQRPQGAFARLHANGSDLFLLLGVNVASVEADNRRLYVARSSNSGQSFSSAVRLSVTSDVDGHASLPILSAEPGGMVAVVFADGEADSGDLYLALSHNGGASFDATSLLGGHAFGRAERTWASVSTHDGGLEILWADPSLGLRWLHKPSSPPGTWQESSLLPPSQLQAPFGPVSVAKAPGDNDYWQVAFAAADSVWSGRYHYNSGQFEPPVRGGRLSDGPAANSVQDVAVAFAPASGAAAAAQAVLFVGDAAAGQSIDWRLWGLAGALTATPLVYESAPSLASFGALQLTQAHQRQFALMHRGNALWLVDVFAINYATDPAAPLGSVGDACVQLLAAGWCKASSAAAPTPRFSGTAVRADNEILYFGGQNGFSAFADGGAYNWQSDQWRPLPSNGGLPTLAAGRHGHTAVWTGHLMLVFGGHSGLGPLGDGFAYYPGTDSWSRLSAENAPSPRFGHTAVWLEQQMVVMGGVGPHGPLADGGVYDLATNTWLPLSLDGPRAGHGAALAGQTAYVWGGAVGPQTYANSGFQWPSGGLFDALPQAGAPSPRAFFGMDWTGSQLLVWGGQNAVDVLNTGAVFTPGVGWQPVSSVNAPSARRDFVHAYTGSHWLVWGGHADGTGGIYDPVLDAWQPMPTSGAPAGRFDSNAVWLGERWVIVGGRSLGGEAAFGAHIFVPPSSL